MVTIKEQIHLVGKGLHSGTSCEVLIEQSSERGIFFKNDESGVNELVSEKTLFGAALGSNFVFEHDRSKKIMTVEHLLAALLMAGVTNAVISIKGCEVPIMDGSGKEFSDAICQSGLVRVGSEYQTATYGDDCIRTWALPIEEITQTLPTGNRRVTTEFELRVGDKFVRIKPREDREVSVLVRIAFDNDCVSSMPQEKKFEFWNDDTSLITSARTFGFKADIDKLLSCGLVLGGSMSNAILISDNQILNPNGLRFADEIVAHKLLDLIGDLSPIFYNYCGFDIECFKCGHKINNEFLVEFSKLNKCESSDLGECWFDD